MSFDNSQSTSVTQPYLSFGPGGMLFQLDMIRFSKKIKRAVALCVNQSETKNKITQSPISLLSGYCLTICCSFTYCVGQDWHFFIDAYCRFSIHSRWGHLANPNQSYKWLKPGDVLDPASRFKYMLEESYISVADLSELHK